MHRSGQLLTVLPWGHSRAARYLHCKLCLTNQIACLQAPWLKLLVGTTHVAAPAHPCARGISASMHVIFEPLDFISRLASLIPKPRVNLTRFHGIFAPNSKYRAQVTLAKRGKGKKIKMPKGVQDQTAAEKRASMTPALNAAVTSGSLLVLKTPL